MRGYLSFVLVLLSIGLVLTLLELNTYSNSTKAILIERSYSISMNVKETILELLWQGAQAGFDNYNLNHDVAMCIHCPACHPKTCDPIKCQKCFKESESRSAAKSHSLESLAKLRLHSFDSDFDVSIGDVQIEVYTRQDPLSKNGFALDSVKFTNNVPILISSEKFDIYGEVKIPSGVMINEGSG